MILALLATDRFITPNDQRAEQRAGKFSLPLLRDFSRRYPGASRLYVVTPLLADYEEKKKANLLIGRSLRLLLKFNLLKGSLSVESGVFMHNISREMVGISALDV